MIGSIGLIYTSSPDLTKLALSDYCTKDKKSHVIFRPTTHLSGYKDISYSMIKKSKEKSK